jgi:SAM-dependent methyltransferase
MPDPVCNLCAARQARRLFRKGGVDFVQCQLCGLEWVDPQPDAAQMRALYSSAEYYRAKDISRYGYTDYVRNKHLYVNLFNRRLDEISRYTDGRLGRLLDVGCATGVLLELARLRGWETHGVDVSTYATQIARDYYNLDVFTGELVEAGFAEASFDLVVMDDLIEHVPDPTALILECHRILRPGGLLTLNTPNRSGLWHLLMGRRWFHYRQSEHLFFFSPPVIGRMLTMHGFQVLKVGSSSKIIDLNHAFDRLRYYNPAVSRLLLYSVGRLLVASITFPIRVGEMVVYARRD